MFTGIIERVGRVESVEAVGSSVRFVVACGSASGGVKLGDSVAVNGTCLTVTSIADECLSFDAVRETLEKSSLESLAPGQSVNLERAMGAASRFDGHIVQGHVDTTGCVRALERRGEDVRFVVDCGAEFATSLVPKGSVAIDGVSLTVVDVEETAFDVVLIPHTLRETNLGQRQPGDPVNLEADILGKYVKRYVDQVLAARPTA